MKSKELAAHLPTPESTIPDSEDIGYSEQGSVYARSVREASVEDFRKTAARKTIRKWTNSTVYKQFEVNYLAPPVEVFAEFVHSTIRKSERLDILCIAWAPGVKAGDPSWIRPVEDGPYGLDFEGVLYRKNGDHLAVIDDSDTLRYHASGYLALQGPLYQSVYGHSSLIVQGFEFDSVAKTGTVAVEGTVPAEWMELGGWRDRYNEDPPEAL